MDCPEVRTSVYEYSQRRSVIACSPRRGSVTTQRRATQQQPGRIAYNMPSFPLATSPVCESAHAAVLSQKGENEAYSAFQNPEMVWSSPSALPRLVARDVVICPPEVTPSLSQSGGATWMTTRFSFPREKGKNPWHSFFSFVSSSWHRRTRDAPRSENKPHILPTSAPSSMRQMVNLMIISFVVGEQTEGLDSPSSPPC